MLPVDHIYVLNLDRRSDKWEKMRIELDLLGWEVERFSAFDCLDPQIEAEYKIHSLFKSAGELACVKSHAAIINDAKDKGYARIAVFEDDVLFGNDFSPLQSLPPSWSLVYLGATQIDWVGVDPKSPFYTPNKTLGTWAMMIDCRVFDRIIKVYEESRSADLSMSKEFAGDPDAFVMYPNLCITDVTGSDIGKRLPMPEFAAKCRWDRTKYGLRSLSM